MKKVWTKEMKRQYARDIATYNLGNWAVETRLQYREEVMTYDMSLKNFFKDLNKCTHKKYFMRTLKEANELDMLDLAINFSTPLVIIKFLRKHLF